MRKNKHILINYLTQLQFELITVRSLILAVLTSHVLFYTYTNIYTNDMTDIEIHHSLPFLACSPLSSLSQSRSILSSPPNLARHIYKYIRISIIYTSDKYTYTIRLSILCLLPLSSLSQSRSPNIQIHMYFNHIYIYIYIII